MTTRDACRPPHRQVIGLLLWLIPALLLSAACAGRQDTQDPPANLTQSASAAQTQDNGVPSAPTTRLASPLATSSPTCGPSILPTAASPFASPESVPERPGAPLCSYSVVNAFPHAPDAFTQGLVLSDGVLLEGTGLNGRSSVRQVDLESGEVLRIYTLPHNYFGEGLTAIDGWLIQLTWHAGVAFVYDVATFTEGPVGEFSYATQGWGLTYDGQHLIMSDGTSTLYFRDPSTFEVVREIQVLDDAAPVTQLNELEYVKGDVFANVWQTDRIAVVDPHDGAVKCWLDLTGILADEDRLGHEDVLNGIAYDAVSDRLFVTGKRWPRLYEIAVELPTQ